MSKKLFDCFRLRSHLRPYLWQHHLRNGPSAEEQQQEGGEELGEHVDQKTVAHVRLDGLAKTFHRIGGEFNHVVVVSKY
jgi:hypothetical protein